MIVINCKRILFLVIFFSFYQLILAQNVEFKNSNFKSDKEGLKNAQKNIKIADTFRESVLLNVLSITEYLLMLCT